MLPTALAFLTSEGHPSTAPNPPSFDQDVIGRIAACYKRFGGLDQFGGGMAGYGEWRGSGRDSPTLGAWEVSEGGDLKKVVNTSGSDGEEGE